ncbi:MAG: methyltransferase domain-containing protein [Myxococcota bacterium]|nr:methyltransferase domain-containing protein [Myxococcota bacterium]
MVNYLNTPFDMNDVDLASAYDEVPYWSFPFGQLMLDNIALRPGMIALDIGFGTGYPMLELSQRLGRSSAVYGIDMWRAGSKRAKFKAEVLGIDNVIFVDGDAATMDFDDDMFDLIVSNVGINNFGDPHKVFSECYRTVKKGGQVAFTTNPKGHMRELYELFAATMTELDLDDAKAQLMVHEDHRHPVETINAWLSDVGFEITSNVEDAFSWRFVDGTAFFNHHMIMRGFVGGFKSVIPKAHQALFFQRLEENINARAKSLGEFKVTIPIAYIEAEK